MFRPPFSRLTLRTRAAGARYAARGGALLVGLMVAASPAWATGGAAMPWDTPLTNILSNLSTTTARVLVLLAVVGCGILWAFTRNEEGLKKLGQIAFGGAIALGSVTLLANLGIVAGATL